MLWAAACLCFFGFMRAGEIVIPTDSSYDSELHLSYGDVRLVCPSNPSGLEVSLKSSKTDPFRLGVTIVVGRTNSPVGLCAVVANVSYMVARGDSSGPYFQFGDGRSLTRARFVQAVRAALLAVGVSPAGYSGHSFRIGGATTAAAQGVSEALIKTMGRWQSAAYLLYVRTPREQLLQVARVLIQ